MVVDFHPNSQTARTWRSPGKQPPHGRKLEVLQKHSHSVRRRDVVSWQISWSNREQGDFLQFLGASKKGFEIKMRGCLETIFWENWYEMRCFIAVCLQNMCRYILRYETLKQFEINLFWDQCIYYSILCFILPVGDSQTEVNEAKHAGRSWTLGFPKKQWVNAKQLSIWTRFDWLFGNSWYDMKK